jgi:Gpi18-like mannosyltransferase
MKTAFRLFVSVVVAAIFALVWHEFSYVGSPRRVVRITGSPESVAFEVDKNFFLDSVNKKDAYVLEVSFFENYNSRLTLHFFLNGEPVKSFAADKKILRIDFPAEHLKNGKNILMVRSNTEWRFKTIRLKNVYGYSSGFIALTILNKKNEFRHSVSDLGPSFYAIFLTVFFLAIFVLGLAGLNEKRPISKKWRAVQNLRHIILLFFVLVLIFPLVTKYRIIVGSRSVLHLTVLYFILFYFEKIKEFLSGAPKRCARFLVAWQEIIGLFVISRAGIYTTGYLASQMIQEGHWFVPKMPSYFLDLFFKWDSFWYQGIIQSGYDFIPGKASNIAFLPFYPMVVKFSSFFIGSPLTNGFVISNTFAFLAVVYLVKLVRLEFGDKKTAARSALYLLIFPGSMFLSFFYAESLFLFLTVAAFYCSRQKRWLAASIFGFFAALTRIMGVLILIPLLIEYFEPRLESGKFRLNSIKPEAFSFLLIPLSLLSFVGYCLVRFGHPLAFVHAQGAWQAKASSPLKTLASIKVLLPPYRPIYVGFVVFSLIIFLVLFLKKLRLSYIAYGGLLLLTVLCAGILDSVPRQLSVIFPLTIGMALLGKNKLVHHFFVLASIILLTIFTILSTNNYWFI